MPFVRGVPQLKLTSLRIPYVNAVTYRAPDLYHAREIAAKGSWKNPFTSSYWASDGNAFHWVASANKRMQESDSR
jgi:hypothetical protein